MPGAVPRILDSVSVTRFHAPRVPLIMSDSIYKNVVTCPHRFLRCVVVIVWRLIPLDDDKLVTLSNKFLHIFPTIISVSLGNKTTLIRVIIPNRLPHGIIRRNNVAFLLYNFSHVLVVTVKSSHSFAQAFRRVMICSNRTRKGRTTLSVSVSSHKHKTTMIPWQSTAFRDDKDFVSLLACIPSHQS